MKRLRDVGVGSTWCLNKRHNDGVEVAGVAERKCIKLKQHFVPTVWLLLAIPSARKKKSFVVLVCNFDSFNSY